MNMSLKTNRRDQVINTIQSMLLSDDFNIDRIKSEILLLLNDEEFFDLMRYRLTSDKQKVQINSLTIITFMILANKYNVHSSQNKEAFEICEHLIKENKINTDLESVLSRI